MVDLPDKDSKEYIINMFKERKTSHARDLKGSLMILIHQIENTKRELEIVFSTRTKWKFWSLKV